MPCHTNGDHSLIFKGVQAMGRAKSICVSFWRQNFPLTELALIPCDKCSIYHLDAFLFHIFSFRCINISQGMICHCNAHFYSYQAGKGNPSMFWVMNTIWCLSLIIWVNSLRPRQHGRHFADNVFKRIFLNENVWISFKISLKFVPKVPMNNIPALVQIMASRRPGDKPLSEPMMVNLMTHICDASLGLNELTGFPPWLMIPWLLATTGNQQPW